MLLATASLLFRYVMSVAEAEAVPVETQDAGPSLDAMITDQADVALNGDAPESIESTMDVPEASEPETEAPAEPDQPSWDDTLLDLAERYDIDRERAKAYGSPEMLRRAMVDIDRSAARWGRTHLESQQPAQQEQQAPPPQTQQQFPAQQAQQQDNRYKQVEKYAGKLDPDAWDQGAQEYLNGLNDHYHQVAAQHEQVLNALAEQFHYLRGQMSDVTGQQQAEGHAKDWRDVDTFVAKLGDEFKEVYGSTPSHRLAADSPLLEQRRRLGAEMLALEAAYGGRFSREELLERANTMLHSDKIQTKARKELQDKLKARQQTQIHRTAGGQPKTKSGRERAIEKVAAMMGQSSYEADDESSFIGF